MTETSPGSGTPEPSAPDPLLRAATGRPAPVRLQRTQVALLAAIAATVPLSIFASQLLLVLSLAVLAARLCRRSARLPRTAVDTPLLAFAVWTLLSASFANDPAEAHEDAKKLLLFTLFYLAVEVMTAAEERRRVLDAGYLGGIALAALMVAQYHWLGFDQVNHRPHGFLGHYMSASGVLMAVLLLACAEVSSAARLPRARDIWMAGGVLLGVGVLAVFAAAGRGGNLPTRLFVAGMALLAPVCVLSAREPLLAARAALPFVAAPLAAWALAVSQTRGAWLGALAGLGALALLRAPRAFGALAALALLAVLLHPGLRARLTLKDASSVDRYYMWQAGVDMVLDRPVFGQGPGMIINNYPSYRWPEAPNPRAPHLHNNVLQLAAERGLPGLAFFVWWAVAAWIVAGREVRRAGREHARSAGMALGSLVVLVAVFAAGLFEYNLGDSEVLMLVLLLNAVPFAMARARALPGAA